MATLPLYNTERVLKSGISLPSPSTAQMKQLLSFLAGTKHIWYLLLLQLLVNYRATFRQY